MVRSKAAKNLMKDIEECGRDNVFSVNRIYGMALVHWQQGNITLHELNEIQDIRDACNIKIIANGF